MRTEHAAVTAHSVRNCWCSALHTPVPSVSLTETEPKIPSAAYMYYYHSETLAQAHKRRTTAASSSAS